MPNSSTYIVVTDKDVKDGINSCFRSAVKTISYHYHVSFLEVCKSFGVYPKGLLLEKRPFIEFVSDDVKAQWKETIDATQSHLLETLIVGIMDKLLLFEEKFWNEIGDIVQETSEQIFSEWAVKLVTYLEKHEKRVAKTKEKKLKKLLTDENTRNAALVRMNEYKEFLSFKNELLEFLENINPDITNIANLNLISSSFMNSNDTNSDIGSSLKDTLEINEGSSEQTVCEITDQRYIGKFVSDNVVNLSGRILSSAEISLLSKGLKFAPTPTNINKNILKEELEIFGRKLRLKWHFRNEESLAVTNPFRHKSKFNPKGKDTAIEMYLSHLEEEILALDSKLKYNNLTREERKALKVLKEDKSIVIKEADKGSAVVVWDRKDYILEAEGQLGNNQVYEECKGDIVSPLIAKIKSYLGKIKTRGDVNQETMDYFFNDNPRLGRFYLLPKIHKRFHNVPGILVISNCGYYTENISSFVDSHLQC